MASSVSGRAEVKAYNRQRKFEDLNENENRHETSGARLRDGPVAGRSRLRRGESGQSAGANVHRGRAHADDRSIVRRFNNFYGPVFPEPQTLLTPVPRTPGTDGRKMSKSYNNSIQLKDTEPEIRAKLKTMVTDPARQRKTDKGDPAKCPVFDLHKAFSTQETRDWATAGCTTASIGCIECKSKLADHVVARIEPMRQKRAALAEKPDTVMDILKDGSARARKVAQATMGEVHQAMKIAY